MSEEHPTIEELRAFLYRQITEARRADEPAQVDDLLEKLANIGELHVFLCSVLE